MCPASTIHAQLILEWQRALDAFGEAIDDEEERRDFSPAELKRLGRHLDADRRWLRRFGALRSFP